MRDSALVRITPPKARGLIADLSSDPFPTQVWAWDGSLRLEGGATHYGFAVEAGAELICGAGRFSFGPGMYFAVPGSVAIAGGAGVVVSRLGYRGLFSLGGPIEGHGRLRYIDGCTDTLLLAPPLLGDPCLNLLCIPAGTRQSSHTHPTLRAGVVAAGEGICVTPAGRAPLCPGSVFTIAAGAEHCFHTDDQALQVIAFHPDSDTGPTHGDHPMLNRTILPRRAARAS